MKVKIMYIPIVFIVIILITIFIALFNEGLFIKKEYLKPWEKDYYKNFEDPRIQVISHGILAANGHNMQNWKFLLSREDNMTFDLLVDTKRLADKVDPYHTQAIISQGTLYEYMEIAANKLGYKLNLVLIPDGDISKEAGEQELYAKRVAKITLEKSEPIESKLYSQIFKPDTNRLAYKKNAVDGNVIDEFNNKNSFDSISISYISPNNENYSKLNNYVIESANTEAGIDRIMEETSNIFRKNEREKNEHRYGFSFEGSSMNPLLKHTLQSMLTLFPSMNSVDANKKSFLDQTHMAVQNNGGYVMLITEDTRVNEFNTGRLYSRLQLITHTRNLTVQPMSQAIEEYPEMKPIYESIHKDFASDNKKILMLFRIGEPEVQASYSMRKDVMDFIK